MVRRSYQSLENAVVDLVRVGVKGNGAGVRQIANRILRAFPLEDARFEEFRAQLAEAMIGTSPPSPLRSAAPLTANKDSDVLHWSEPVLSGLPQIVLSGPAEDAAEGLIRQWQSADSLLRAGLSPANAVLLEGPSGVGKTLLARHLAAQLNLPLARIDLAQVISSLFGGTGRNLRDAMLTAAETPCVFLMDEFDALAKRRDDISDIGELKRIVNIMLLELDQWSPDRLLIAATNHPQLLDSAVARRFETVIRLDLPGTRARAEQFRILLEGDAAAESVIPLLAKATAGRSQAHIEKSVRIARRNSLLESIPLDRSLIITMLHGTRTSAERDKAMAQLKIDRKMSNREIARLFGVSHPTVADAIRRAENRLDKLQAPVRR